MSTSSTSEVSSAASISSSLSLNNKSSSIYSGKSKRNKPISITADPPSASSSNTICTKRTAKSKPIPSLQKISQKKYKFSQTKIPIKNNEVILSTPSTYKCFRCQNHESRENRRKFIDEPLVKCNGHLCKRIYHLSCTKLPVNCIMYNSIVKLHRQHQQSSQHEHGPQIIDVSDGLENPHNGNNKDHCLENEDDFQIYLCPKCDIEGSSKFLMEYLQPFNQKKDQVPLVLCPNNIYKRVKCEIPNNSCTKRNQNINGNSNFTKKYQIQSKQQNECQKWIQQQSEINHEKINELLCNRTRQIDKNQIFKKETKNKSLNKYQDCNEMHKSQRVKQNSYDIDKSLLPSSPPSTPLSQSDHGDIYEEKYSHVFDKPKVKSATPSIFIGQPVKLYCPIDNSYHVGRIIDMRERQWNKRNSQARENSSTHKESNKNHNDDDEKYHLNQVEFLIRFRAGMDGRKVTVHGWIVLEDHSLMVGIMLIWVQFNLLSQNLNENGIKGYNNDCDSQHSNINVACKKQLIPYYSPAQVMLRSGLEMLALNEGKSNSANTLSAFNDEKKSNLKENTDMTFVLFFGRDINTHASVNMMSKSIYYYPPSTSFLLPLHDPNYHQSARQLNFNPNDQNDRRFLAFSIAMATIENEEQRHIRKSHNLSTTYQQIFISETRDSHSQKASQNLQHLNKSTCLPQNVQDGNKLANSLTTVKTTSQISPLEAEVMRGDSKNNSLGFNASKVINGEGNQPNFEQNGHGRKQEINEDDNTNFETESEPDSINSS